MSFTFTSADDDKVLSSIKDNYKTSKHGVVVIPDEEVVAILDIVESLDCKLQAAVDVLEDNNILVPF